MAENLRVLIVDDDFHVARLHVAYVNGVPGFTALTPVGSGDAAVRAGRALSPDLMLIDIYLPDLSGLDVLGALDIDAFVISASSDAASVRRAFRRGALAYLIKPFAVDVLTRKLIAYARYRRVLGGDRTIDQEVVERALGIMHPVDKNVARSRAVTGLAILEVLRGRDEPANASDIAAIVGMSRATAQRYLSGLVDDGSISVQLRYGTAGRPEHRYSIRTES